MPAHLGSTRGRPAAPADRAAAGGPTQAVVPDPLAAAILDTVDVAVVACDAAGRLTYFNPTAQRFHGLDADPTVDPSDWASRFDLYRADGVTRPAPHEVPLRRALATGGPVTDERLVIRPVGAAPRLVRCDGRELRSAAGEVIGAVVAMTDIGELSALQDRLRCQTELTARIVRASHDAYIGCDEQGVIREWNPAAEALFGWPEAVALRETAVELLSPEPLREAHRASLVSLLARDGVDHGSREVEARLRRRDGTTFRAHLTTWPSYGDGVACHAFVHPD